MRTVSRGFGPALCDSLHLASVPRPLWCQSPRPPPPGTPLQDPQDPASTSRPAALPDPGNPPPPFRFFSLQNLALWLCLSSCCHSRLSQLLGNMPMLWDQPASVLIQVHNSEIQKALKIRGFLVNLTQTRSIAKPGLNREKPILFTLSFVHLMWIRT